MPVRVVTEQLGGSALATAAINGRLPAHWLATRPLNADEWSERVRHIAASRSFPDESWYRDLAPAFDAAGPAKERLERVALGRGAVVTTGQQPGLFGGPVYTWSKALSALALADALQDASGVEVAPVFWAATDDADFVEASWTSVAHRGGSSLLQMTVPPTNGITMARLQVGDLRAALDELRKASGSAANASILEAVERCYDASNTVGGAYVSLLRHVLEPLGIAVLDASHPSVRFRGAPIMRRALSRTASVEEALATREKELRRGGFTPQVQHVPGLSLVFREDDGRKERVPANRVSEYQSDESADHLSPNVLLRPILEAEILPTVAYVAGPGEMAYFPQVSAVAHSLTVPVPLAVPRWSCTIVEVHVARILERRGLSISDLADPHGAWGRLAREEMPPGINDALRGLRGSISKEMTRLMDSVGAATTSANGIPLVSPQVLEGAHASLDSRLRRLERRLIAGAKRANVALGEDIATARGALYPLGKRQERAMNIIPLIARHGRELLLDMLEKARGHAERIVYGSQQRGDAQEASTSGAVQVTLANDRPR